MHVMLEWMDQAGLQWCETEAAAEIQADRHKVKVEMGWDGGGQKGRKKYQLWQRLLFHFSHRRLCLLGQWGEGPQWVSMATAYLSRDGENKGAVRQMQFGPKRSISLLTWVEWKPGYFKSCEPSRCKL